MAIAFSKKSAQFFFFVSLLSLILVSSRFYFPFVTIKTAWFRAAINLSLASLLIYTISNPRCFSSIRKRILHPLSLSVIAFTIILVGTAFTGVNPYNSFWSNLERGEGGLQMIYYTAFFVLAISLFQKKREWQLLSWLFITLSTLVAFYSIGQLLHLPGFLSANNAISGTLGNPFYLSSFLIFSLFFSLWLFFQYKSPLLKLILLCLTAVFTILLSLDQPLFTIISLLISFLVFWGIYTNNKKGIWLFLALLLIGTSIVSAALINNKDQLQSRFWIWESALAGILEKPLLGWGAENFPVVFDKYYNANLFGKKPWYDRAQNAYLDYWIAGGIALLLAYFLIYWTLFKTLKKQRDKETALFFALPTAHLLSGILIFETLPAYLGLFLFLALAVNQSFHFQTEDMPLSSSYNKPSFAKLLAGGFILISAVILVFYTSYLPLKKAYLIAQANQIQPEEKIQTIIDEFKQALSFPSPVGQQEADESFYLFAARLIKTLRQQQSPLIKNFNFINQLAEIGQKQFQKNSRYYAGSKPLYAYLLMQVEIFNAVGGQSQLKLIKQLLSKALKKAPTRIEFLQIQAEIASLEKDFKMLDKIKSKINKLRPDLKLNF